MLKTFITHLIRKKIYKTFKFTQYFCSTLAEFEELLFYGGEIYTLEQNRPRVPDKVLIWYIIKLLKYFFFFCIVHLNIFLKFLTFNNFEDFPHFTFKITSHLSHCHRSIIWTSLKEKRFISNMENRNLGLCIIYIYHIYIIHIYIYVYKCAIFGSNN